MLPLLRAGPQREGGGERMSWALVELEGPGRHPGETLRGSGALEEGPALSWEVSIPGGGWRGLLSAELPWRLAV